MSTGPAPHKVITKNASQSGQRSSFWVISVCSFGEPAAMYSPGKLQNPVDVKELIIIENDAINVTINQTKDSFGKMANITLKSTNVYYPSLVHNGDWIFIWMFDTQNKADQCVTLLNTVVKGGAIGSKLCDWKSGLKHVGRITSVHTVDSVNESARTITQTIQSQSFLEFATSVYYTYSAAAAVGAVAAPSAAAGTGILSYADAGNFNQQHNGLDRSLTDLADKFINFYKSAKDNSQFSPDNIIALYFILIMGIDSDAAANNFGGIKGTFNDGISIPKDVATIMNAKAKKIWQLYSMVLGVQKFKADNTDWFKSFAPITESVGFSERSSMRCKGFVPFTPVMWSNQSMWSILEQYLNPVCNEMFTSLRLDKNGILKPTFTVREKPFTTGLRERLTAAGKVDPSLEAKQKSSQNSKSKLNPLTSALSAKTQENDADNDLKPSISFGSGFPSLSSIAGAMGKSASEATFFATLPRWVIDPSMVTSFSWGTDEARRVNFIQVFGRSSASDFAGAQNVSPESLKQSQFIAGNYVADEVDIARNGLRAVIQESQFDTLSGETVSGSLAPLWARMNADWMFNGHLKAFGSITMQGVWEPIAEGDNLQYNGILFHIEGISQSASITGGIKSWTTTVTLSNGILADSMADTKSLPLYPAHSDVLKFRKNVPGPGFSIATERLTDQSKSLSLSDLFKKVLK